MSVRVTIEFEYDPERQNYDKVYDVEGNKLKDRTPEELEALTEQEMADDDKESLKRGDFGIIEFMEWSDFVWDKERLEKHVKFEAI